MVDEDSFNRELGKRLRAARTAKGLFGPQVGKSLHRGRQAVSDLERGKCPVNVFRLFQLASLYEVTPEALISGLGELGEAQGAGSNV